MTRACAVLAASGLLLATAWADDKRDEGDPAAQIQGTYQIVAGQEGDKKIPEDRLGDNTVRITADTITVLDKDRKEVYVATYKLDAGKKPWALQMTATVAPEKGAKAAGLIMRDGENLKLIYALPGGDAPDSFTPREKQQLFVLRRQSRDK